MKLLNFKPSRTKLTDQSDLVSDLDALIEKPITFRLFGKVHEIKPISTSEFFKVLNSLQKLHALHLKNGKYDEKDLLDSYVELIGSVCSTIGKKEIERMTQAQVVALVQIIIDTVSGKMHAEVEKKKTLPIGQLNPNDLKPDL